MCAASPVQVEPVSSEPSILVEQTKRPLRSDVEAAYSARMSHRAEFARLVGVIAAAIAFALLIPPAAFATSPVLDAPAPGSSFEAENPPSFTVTDTPPAGSEVWLSVSSSPQLDSQGQLGHDVDFAAMNLSGGSTYTWAPTPWPGSYPWLPGVYYWQVAHIDCLATPSCYVTSPVGQFALTPVPAPEPISPANGTTVQSSSTVFFSVYSAISGDLGVRIDVPTGSGTPYEFAPYGIGIDGHTSYFKVQLGGGTGTLNWTVLRADCRLGSSCPHVLGPTWSLTVLPSPTSTPSVHRCRRGFRSASIGGRHVCLHAGEFCAKRYRKQYHRYHFSCVLIGRRYRLERT